MPMVNNSTLFFIIDDINYRSELIDFDRLEDMEKEYLTELDTLIKAADYSPSDEVIKRILTWT
jgi:predicted component of viral defense system (DUF524 family)